MPGDWLSDVKERTHGRNLRHKRLLTQGHNSVAKHFSSLNKRHLVKYHILNLISIAYFFKSSLWVIRFPLGEMGTLRDLWCNSRVSLDFATELGPQIAGGGDSTVRGWPDHGARQFRGPPDQARRLLRPLAEQPLAEQRRRVLRRRLHSLRLQELGWWVECE